ncbi:hypothetical protein Cpir12675_005366 [Ceratocystis pirilliformis]|uniref:Uncharacterized protein n=1 Tax=Ceratocystis pirilliformis TaxID=259994 RepID=A0ABR3YRL5_9PEZI
MAMAGSIDMVPDISPDTTLLASGGLQEPTLPSNLAEIPIYKVPYAEHLLDNVKTPEDFKALPPVTFYLHGSKVSANPWFYYSSRFKHMPAFSQYAIDEASEALSSTKSLSAGISALMPYMPVYQVPYREELLENVKTPKDLEALPRVTIYIHGAKVEADPWIYYSHRFKDLPAFADYYHVEKEDSASNKAPPAAETTPTFGEDGLPTNLDSIPLYKVDYPEDLVHNVKTPDDFDRLPQMKFYNNGSKIQASPWSVYGNLFADLPEFSHYSPMGSFEDPLPAYISKIPWYNASYPTHLIEQAKTKKEILKLPDAVVYRYGVPTDIPAWKMFMLGDFDVTAMERSIDNAVPPLPQEPSASQLLEQPEAELPDDLESLPFYQVPYDEKLFDSIKSTEDYLKLPSVIVYLKGKKSAIPAWIYYFDRFMGLEVAMPDNEDEASEDNLDMEYKRDVDRYLPDDHEEPSETINHSPDAAQITLPPNLDTLPSWPAPYPMELLDDVHNIGDLMNLPPAIVYIYGQSTNVPAYIAFQDRFKTLTESQPSTSTDMPTISSDHDEPHATFSSSPATGKGYDSSENENSPAMITAAPSSELPANLKEIEFFKIPYNEDLINKINKPEDFFGLPDFTVYVYGHKTVVPAWLYFSKKLEEVSEGRTSFAAFEFFAAAATATAQVSSSSSGPVIATPAAINALPVHTDAPQTSNNAVAANPKIDLPDNLHEIPEFEVPYDLSLLDNVKTPQDLANLPDAIVFEYGNMKAVPAIQRFASKLLELVEASSTSIDPLDIFKPGPDFATEEPQASTTFSTITRITSSASFKTIKS